MNDTATPGARVLRYCLEIRDESGQLIKTLVGDADLNTITAEYPDGTKEVVGAFN